MSRGGYLPSSSQPNPLAMSADGPNARLFETAVRHAIELVNADGGAIATLDDAQRGTMVLRVRQVHPRLLPDALRAAQARQLNLPILEEAATTVLHTAQLWRMYRLGERLIGHIWQSGDPVILSGDEVRGLPSGNGPEDPDAPWHLGVPIYAPESAQEERASDKPPKVIGVITVYVNDPHWRFTQHHLNLLQGQAQNIALTLQLAHVEQQELRHRRLLTLLQELTSDVPIAPDPEAFYATLFERARIAISGVLDTEAFAVALPKPQQPDNTLALYAVVDSGHEFPLQLLPEDKAPWWKRVRFGEYFAWATDDQRRAMPQLRQRDWGTHRYMDSQLFVPIKAPSGVVGALLVASTRANAYTREHAALLEMAGRYLGMALEHAQLRGAQRAIGPTNSSDHALSLLNNSLMGMNATLNVDDIVRDLVEQASELARGQVCGYLEFDARADELVIRDIAQNKDHPYSELIGQRVEVGTGRRHLALEGQSQVLDDLTEDYGRDDELSKLLERYHVKAMLLAPVIYRESVTHRDRVLGLLAIYAPDQTVLISPKEDLNLQALGHVAAAAINNAHTYAQLRELDRLKDEFILTASHEFRTPMSAIQGFSWLIQRRGESMTADQGKHWAGEIMRATEQLKDMMDTVTEAWRTKSVQLPVSQPVEVAAAVQLALEISSGLLAADNHATQSVVPENLWVQSEQDRLRHVVSNLLVNAAKYSPPNSPITVTASVKTAAELLALPRERGSRGEEGDDEPIINVTQKTGAWVVVSVRDQGMGISAANQKRLFAKFVRLELTTSVRGTGLGLYICRRYIEAMGGEIWVDSAPGQGSTFSFCLPQCAPPPA